jgi:hypothetical protein
MREVQTFPNCPVLYEHCNKFGLGTVWHLDAERAEGYAGLVPLCGPKALPAPGAVVARARQRRTKAFPVGHDLVLDFQRDHNCGEYGELNPADTTKYDPGNLFRLNQDFRPKS